MGGYVPWMGDTIIKYCSQSSVNLILIPLSPIADNHYSFVRLWSVERRFVGLATENFSLELY